MTVNLSLLGGAGWQFLDNNGPPLSAIVPAKVTYSVDTVNKTIGFWTELR